MNFNINRGVSTPVALTIIIALAVVLVGGAYAFQYYYIPVEETEIEIPGVTIPEGGPETPEPGQGNKCGDGICEDDETMQICSTVMCPEVGECEPICNVKCPADCEQ